MAAALVGFGTVGSASAHMEWSGFGDVNMNVYDSDFEEGNFYGSGELDVMQKDDGGPTFRADFDLNNCHNRSAAVDLPTGTDPTNGSLDCGVGVDIEQLRVDIPVNGMATVTAGIFNGFHGQEGQDATDLDFAANGLLWLFVPSNVAGGMVEVTPTDMVAVKVAYINNWTDLPQATYIGSGTNAGNDVMAAVWVGPMEGLDINVSYLTDNNDGRNGLPQFGDELDVNATVSMVENLTLAAEYLMADPASGSGGTPLAGFDNGWGVNAAYVFGPITAAGRYEAATFEGSGPDVTSGSIAVSYDLAASTLVRADFTSTMVDTVDNNDTFTLQLVHTFDGMDTM